MYSPEKTRSGSKHQLRVLRGPDGSQGVPGGPYDSQDALRIPDAETGGPWWIGVSGVYMGPFASYLGVNPITDMYFTLPDLPRICPFPPSFSPHFNSVAPESKAWIDSFGILSGRQKRYFSTSAFELLAAHTYPYADREGYRTSCDYLNVTFILDDYSDDEGRRGARIMADSFMNALRDPTWDNGTAFARLARELVDLIPLPLVPFTNDTSSSGSGKD